jgi:alpha-aminoadipate carrier protein LysW
MSNAECEECAKAIDLTDMIEGELMVCPECGTDLEVVSLVPPKLQLAPAEQEDWGE